MCLIFNLGLLRRGCHCEWSIDHLVVCRCISWHLHKLLPLEVNLIIRGTGNICLYLPWFRCWVLELYLLGFTGSNYTLELKLLDALLWLLDALSKKVHEEWVSTLDIALYFEVYVVVGNVRVESNLEVQVLVCW